MSGKKTTVSLDDILAQRDKALADVRKSGRRIRTLTGSLFEPPKAEGRLGGIINNLDRIMAVYDGIMLGTKIIRRVRGFVRRR